MATAELEERQGARHTQVYNIPDWRQFDDNTYQCRCVVWPRECGGFVARALRLPGVTAESDTLEEALSRMAEAFQDVITKYLDEGKPIPWCDVEVEASNDASERILLVSVPREDVSGTPSNDELRSLAKRHRPPQAWLNSNGEDDLL